MGTRARDNSSRRLDGFFTDAMQGMMYGGATVGDKPAGYRPPVTVRGAGAGVA